MAGFHRFDAGAEGRAGEEDPVASRRNSKVTRAEGSVGHRGREPAITLEVGREAVVQEVHQQRPRPKLDEGGLDQRDRVL